MWKDIYWQDKEFELNTLGPPHLTRKRRSYDHTLFAKSWQSRATPDIFHYSTLQRTTRKSGPKSTRKAIHYSTVLAQREKKLTPVYHTILRKQDRTPDAKQDKQFVATTERLPTQKRVNKEVNKTPAPQTELHDHALRSLSQVTLQDYIELHNITAKQYGYSEAPVQVYHSEQEAVRACELAGEHCRAISKQNEETTFIFTLASDFTLSSDAKSTLYVKAEFIAKLEFSDNELSCGVPLSKMQQSSTTTVEGCRLPDIDPFDKNAMRYFLTSIPMTCDLKPNLFTRYRNGSLEVVTNHDRGNATARF
ncbi:hypothetical protein OS493_034261 [Desmophyllum pertusum]|uniref:Uncharacterized protein n=1 Tax=Desmophyllum pertusum TaxID=174260 RepID=A0A9W9ZAH4_9CNID|nr:hypothetical protein OS493_034261 [Desmophyllum pertusum]